MTTHIHCKLSDTALMAAWRRNDYAHIGALFVRHRGLIRCVARRFRMDADDLFQQSVAIALTIEKGHSSSHDLRSFGSWLASIARNFALNEYTSAKRRSRYLEQIGYWWQWQTAPASLIPEPDEPKAPAPLLGVPTLWTDREIHTLRGAWSELGRSVLLELLPGRSWASIEHKAAKLGLVREFRRSA